MKHESGDVKSLNIHLNFPKIFNLPFDLEIVYPEVPDDGNTLIPGENFNDLLSWVFT